MSVGLGTGCTVAFSSGSTFAGVAESFNIDGEEVAIHDFTHLGTTGYKELKPGTLISPPQVNVTLQFDPAAPPPAPGTLATLTITWPNGGTAKTFSGTGFFVSRGVETETETKMVGTYLWQFDGGTGPVFA